MLALKSWAQSKLQFKPLLQPEKGLVQLLHLVEVQQPRLLMARHGCWWPLAAGSALAGSSEPSAPSTLTSGPAAALAQLAAKAAAEGAGTVQPLAVYSSGPASSSRTP